MNACTGGKTPLCDKFIVMCVFNVRHAHQRLVGERTEKNDYCKTITVNADRSDSVTPAGSLCRCWSNTQLNVKYSPSEARWRERTEKNDDCKRRQVRQRDTTAGSLCRCWSNTQLNVQLFAVLFTVETLSILSVRVAGSPLPQSPARGKNTAFTDSRLNKNFLCGDRL